MLKEIPYVYAVYKEQSFSKAAEIMHITQPVVSTMVKNAEQEYGARIFDRTTRPVSLTPAGKIYIRAVEQIMTVEKETLSLFTDRDKEQAEMVRVGASTLFCTYLLPPVLKEFRKKTGDITVYWREQSSSDMRRLLQKGKLDLVLEVDDYDSTIFESIVCGEENLILAVPSADPVNDRLKNYRYTGEEIRNRKHLKDPHHVALDAFSGHSFITLKEGNDTTMRTILLCQRAGFQPKVSMDADHLMTCYNLIRAGNGIGFVPDYLPIFDAERDTLFFYTVDSSLTRRTIKLYAYRNRYMTAAVKAFWDYLKSHHFDL